MVHLALGSSLSLEVQQELLRRFPHRYTGDNQPDWSRKEWKDGKPYPLQHASDADWLAHTEFWVTKAGKLSKAHHYCESRPTWPNNPELRKD